MFKRDSNAASYERKLTKIELRRNVNSEEGVLCVAIIKKLKNKDFLKPKSEKKFIY